MKMIADEELKITVQKLPEIVLQITSVGPVGLEMVTLDGISLMVTEVPDSLVMSPARLQKHDRIIGVNSVRSDSVKLEKELANAELPIDVVFRRFRI